VPLSTLVDSVVKVGAARGQSPKPVPVGDDLVQSRAGHRDRPGVSGIQKVEKSCIRRSRSRPASRATPRHSEQSLKSTPILIVASLFVIYLILGVLYES